MRVVEHNGKQIRTSHFDGNIDMDIVNEIRNGYYKEDKDKALANLRKILIDHQTRTSDLYNYYFARVANDTVVANCKWSINEALASDELVQTMYNKTLINNKVYYSNNKLTNFKKAIDLSGAGYFKKATQFPINIMRNLLDEFTKPGDLYYDPCCGWGMRMLVSAEKGVKYIGNDINVDLVNKLQEFGKDINTIKEFKHVIIPQGSEIFIPHLENKVDFIFTSPPYFDLEVYKGSEKLKETSYDMWLENFIRPMLENCFKYIKDGKHVAINIKNGRKNMLYDDTRDIAEQVGFKFVGERDLKQGNRTVVNQEKTIGDSSEKIMVLQKVSG